MDNPQNPYQPPANELEVREVPQLPAGPYGFWQTLAIGVLIGCVVFFANFVVLVAWMTVASLIGQEIDQENISMMGDLLAVSTCVGNFAGAVALVIFIRNRVDHQQRSYLGFLKFKWWWLLVWFAVLYAMLRGHGYASDFLGKEPVVQSTLDMIASTKWMWLLVAAVCIAAPIFEEMLIRGFLYTGWRGKGSKLRIFVAMFLSSAIFSVIHLQYFGYEYFWLDLLAIFSLGLILCAARETSGSIWPPIILHAVNNTLALIISAQHLPDVAAG